MAFSEYMNFNSKLLNLTLKCKFVAHTYVFEGSSERWDNLKSCGIAIWLFFIEDQIEDILWDYPTFSILLSKVFKSMFSTTNFIVSAI